MSDADPSQRARAATLRLLSYRPRSEAEVRVHLRRRFDSPVVEKVIDTLVEQSLLDDIAFARLWSESRHSHHPRSAWAVKRELTAKGVDRDIAAEAVEDIDDEESAYRAGLRLAQKLEEADIRTFRRKIWGYLRRRGFSESVSRHTTDRLWKDQPQIQEGH